MAEGAANEYLTEWWKLALEKDRRGRLAILKESQELSVGDRQMTSEHLAKLREQFNRNRRRYPLADNCFVCNADDALIRHHILALRYWGPNRKVNIVTLCNGCHGEIHWWLDPHKQRLMNYDNDTRHAVEAILYRYNKVSRVTEDRMPTVNLTQEAAMELLDLIATWGVDVKRKDV